MIYIIGPTSSGKTALAVHIANIFNCEIISADSRQVYKYMDIGTGKDLKEYGKIKYHCIDLITPKTEYNLAKYIKQTHKAIKEIEEKNKIPLIVGGTGLYINALLQNYNLENSIIDEKYRKELLTLTKSELQTKLLKLNPKAKTELNNSDWNNPHRLIRQIEKLTTLSCPSDNSVLSTQYSITNDNIIIGISISKEILHKRIYNRIVNRIDNERLLEEIYDLHYKHKISWKKIKSFGLEYRFLADIANVKYKIKNKKTKISNKEYEEKLSQSINSLSTATNQFAKRQMTWFKKTPGVIWLNGENKEQLYKEAEKIVASYKL